MYLEMDGINIVNRELTPSEVERMDAGFEELALEEGVEVESSALTRNKQYDE